MSGRGGASHCSPNAPPQSHPSPCIPALPWAGAEGTPGRPLAQLLSHSPGAGALPAFIPQLAFGSSGAGEGSLKAPADGAPLRPGWETDEKQLRGPGQGDLPKGPTSGVRRGRPPVPEGQGATSEAGERPCVCPGRRRDSMMGTSDALQPRPGVSPSPVLPLLPGADEACLAPILSL